jgi:hypothetical protein
MEVDGRKGGKGNGKKGERRESEARGEGEENNFCDENWGNVMVENFAKFIQISLQLLTEKHRKCLSSLSISSSARKLTHSSSERDSRVRWHFLLIAGI